MVVSVGCLTIISFFSKKCIIFFQVLFVQLVDFVGYFAFAKGCHNML